MGVPEETGAGDCRQPDEESRHAAVQALHGRAQQALPALLAALGDPSWRVRKAAIDVVLEAPPEASIPLLLAGLRDQANAGLRNSCMETLVRLGAAAVPWLEPLVTEPDPDLRKFVVDALGNIETPEATALLRGALEDREENVSAAAAEHLGRRRDAASVPALLRRLGDGEAWLTFGSLRALGEIGDAAAAPAITRLLGEPGMRNAALEALGRVGGAPAVPHLLEALFSRDRGLRRIAALAAYRLLSRLGSGAAASEFRSGVALRADAGFFAFVGELLRHDDAQVRAAGVLLLGAAPGQRAASIAIDLLPEVSEADQELLAGVLRRVPDEALPLLAERLLDPAPAVRLRVAEVLGLREFRDAVPALLTLLDDATGHVRAAAAAALGRIGEPAAVAPLAGLLRDAFPDVREAGVDAIVAIGRRSDSRRTLVLALLEPHFAAPEEEFAAAVVRIAGLLGGRGVAERLGNALRDDRGTVRRAAVEALGALGGPEAVGALRIALTDEDVAVRREAVVRLGATREPGALRLLLPMLGDDDLWVRVRSVQALGGFADPEAWQVLLAAAASDPPGPRRLAAVRALGAGRVPGSLPVLTELAESGDRETGMAAIEALGVLGDPAAIDVLLARLADPAWGLRAVAVRALGPLAAHPRVRAALERAAAGDADPLVRSLAERILSAPAAAAGGGSGAPR